MSNGIAKRENEEKSIKLLAAQRKLYKEVGRLNSIDFFPICYISNSCFGCIIVNY